MVKASNKFEAFSKRLRKALADAGVDAGHPTHLAREFSTRFGDRVTPQAVRKWLNGESIPSLEKIETLAVWLKVPTSWLHYAKGEGVAHMAKESIPPYGPVLSDQELLKRYHQLSKLHQSAVAELVTALAVKSK